MRMSVSPRRTLLFTRTNSQSLQVLGGLIIEKRGTCFSDAVRELLVALFAGKTRATGTAVTLSFFRSQVKHNVAASFLPVLEWTKRFPNPVGEGAEAEIEVRQLYELDDLGPSDAIERFREPEAREE
jgi:hypothetical protein